MSPYDSLEFHWYHYNTIHFHKSRDIFDLFSGCDKIGPMNADLEKLLSVKDVLAYLHVGRTTLHRMMKARKIAFVRIGKKIFFTQEQIETFIRKGTVLPKK